ncbi:peptidoglycan-binding protein [Actinomadura darangshiensis]|uniref:Peptidoglycan-binding protein n=1 Tax=Actinomadura darangshiensis TaxID=705336 RepID=A0A4R4ZPK0_9ACTN|nr:peptidoglycan-binding protein [Actinomadura darangshiensis]TDD59749.1 peptidoglycan-binding protein [Actinomadura darangshiensis]
MKVLLRAVLGIAATLLALGVSVGAMNAANADGPDTNPAVTKAIQSQPWVELGPGDSDYRIASARCYLVQFGYYDDCTPTSAGEGWPADLGPALKKYQASHNLPESGRLDAETWGALRDDGGEIGQGSGRHSQVKGIQYAMKVLQDGSVVADGYYGAATANAVTAFQKRKEIDADGIFGPITFRAAFAEGAEAQRTPGR